MKKIEYLSAVERNYGTRTREFCAERLAGTNDVLTVKQACEALSTAIDHSLHCSIAPDSEEGFGSRSILSELSPDDFD